MKMIIGIISKSARIPTVSIVKYLHNSYGFTSLDLRSPAINIASVFTHSQGYKPSEDDYYRWHQLIYNSLDRDYRINYMNHMLDSRKISEIDIIINNIEDPDEIDELKRRGALIMLLSNCDCNPPNVDIRLNDENAYQEIDRIMDLYRIEKE